MLIKTRFIYLIIIFLSFLMLFSCASRDIKQFNETDNPNLKMLKVREQTFQHRYRLAERMYKEMQAQYPDNPALLVEIDYEIAFLKVKQKKYKESKPLFEAIINRYDLDANSNQLPQWPYYLSKKILYDIVEVKLNAPPLIYTILPQKWQPSPKKANAEE